MAELQSLQSKQSMMEGTRNCKLNGKFINTNWNDNKIYINNSLTPFNLLISFFKTRHFRDRDVGYKFVWYENSQLFIKKNENTKTILIDNEYALTKLS